jgi:hypothetical protein
MSGLLLGGLISGALSLGKAVVGGIQAAKGNKQMKNLLANRPTYNIPEAYQKSLGIFQNLAASEMPGLQRTTNLIGESTARAMTGAERGAISSNVYQGAVETAQDKELQALQNLAKMGAEYKVGAMQNLAGAQTQMGQLQDQAFEYNQNQPWQYKMNMAAEQRQAGAQNMFGGLGDIGSTVQNFVGTKYMADIYKSLYPQDGEDKNQLSSGQLFSNILAPYTFKNFPK